MSPRLLALIAVETGKPGLTLETRIEDLGLDSLERVELMLTIGKTFRDISDEQWLECQTIGDIERALQLTSAC